MQHGLYCFTPFFAGLKIGFATLGRNNRSRAEIRDRHGPPEV
jgi:hypothetical protein